MELIKEMLMSSLLTLVVALVETGCVAGLFYSVAQKT